MNILSSLILPLFIGQLTVLEVASQIELSYEELTKINAACRPRDTCFEARYGDGISSDYSCSCGSQCSKLGNCCIDSDRRSVLSPKLKPSCRPMGGHRQLNGFYMVDKCGGGDEISSVWKSLCENGWNGEDNVMTLTPVTSLFSSMTYKNFFCLRCHETTDEFLFWDVTLTGNSKNLQNGNDFTFTYDKDQNKWLAAEEGNNDSIPVKLRFEIPTNISFLAERCDPNTISNCSDSWEDDVIREKCEAYTALVYIIKTGKTQTYKNPHCALCNNESLEKMMCELPTVGILDTSKKTFSFSRLLNVNLPEGGEPKCEENFVWDPYENKCRKLSCAIPGYVVKNGRCSLQ